MKFFSCSANKVNEKQVPLSEIADVNFKASPAQRSREDAEHSIVVEAKVRGRDVESVVKNIPQTLDAKPKLREGFYINYGGRTYNLIRCYVSMMNS